MPEEIGAISIGISADVGKLRSQLAEIEREVKARKFAEKEIPIRVRITTPTDAAVQAAQKKIAQSVARAQKFGVELTPELTIKGTKLKDFSGAISRGMAGYPVNVKITADVDGNALREQIQKAIGVVDVPLRWFWENGPPTGGGGPGGGGGGGGGGGVRRGTSRPTKGGGGGAGTVSVVEIERANKELQDLQNLKTELEEKGGSKTQQYVQTKTKIRETKAKVDKLKTAQSAPAQPKTASPSTPAPTITPAVGGGIFTRLPTPDSERPQRSAPPTIFEQMVGALKRNQLPASQREDARIGRPAFSGGALRLAGGGAGPESAALSGLLNKLQDEAKAFREKQGFNQREDVVALKQRIKQEGFIQAIFGAPTGRAEGGNLSDAAALLEEGDLPGARNIAADQLRLAFAVNPKMAAQLFPSKKKGTKSRINRQGEYVEPPIELESASAAIMAIFGEAGVLAQPRIFAGEKAERKRAAGERRETSNGMSADDIKIAKARARDNADRNRRERDAFNLVRSGGTRVRLPDENVAPLPIDILDVNNNRVNLSERSAYDAEYREQLFREQVRRPKAVRPTVYPKIRFLPASKGGIGEFSPYPRRAAGGHVFGDSALNVSRGGEVEHVSIETLRKYRDIDREKTPRMRNDFEYLDQLTAAMKAGVDLGPVVLDHDPRAPLNTKLFDGNHRLAAAERLGLKSLPTRMRFGGLPSKFGFRAAGGGVGGKGGSNFWDRNFKKEKLSTEDLDRLFGDKPGMWWDKEARHFRYANEAETAEERIKRNEREANEAFRNFHSTRGAGGGGARPPKASSLGDSRTRVDKLKAMADQSVSPNEAAIAKRILHDKGIEGYAAGGSVGGLGARLAAARAKRQGEYLVGEKRAEMYRSTSGRYDRVVGQNGPEITSFPEAGKIEPSVPAWVLRMDKNAKDMTRRAAGGPVYQGDFAAEPKSGRGAPYKKTRSPFEGERAAVGSGQLSPAGSVQRVFVVNWPGALGARAAQSAPAGGAAAGPFTSPQFQQFAAAMGGAFRQSGGKAAGAGKAPGGATPRIKAEDDPEGRVQREIDLLKRQTARRFDIQLLGAERTSTLAQVPTRGIQTALGEISATTLGGRAGITQRARIAQAAAEAAGAVERKLTAEERTLFQLEEKRLKLQKTSATPKQLAAVTDQIDRQRRAIGLLGGELNSLKADAENYNKQIASGSDKLKVFATNTAGIIGGTLIFGGVLGAVQGAMAGVSQILGPLVERMTGFKNVTGAVTGELSDQVRASGGAVKSVVAQREATLGLATATADLINPLVERRAQTEAGNKAFKEQIDLFHAFEELQRQNKGGVDQGITSTTGGLFGTLLGGVPSTFEQIGNELDILPAAQDQKHASVEAQPVTSLGGPLGGMAFPALTEAHDFSEELKDGAARLKNFNDLAEKGGEHLVRLSIATADETEAVNKSVKLAEDAQLPEFAKKLRENSVKIEGATKPEDLLRYGQAVNFANTRPNADLLVRQMTDRIIPNQLAAFDAESQFQLKTAIPAQRAVDFLGNPPLPFGTGFEQVAKGTNGALPTGAAPIKSLGGSLAIDPTAKQSFDTYRTTAEQAINAVVAKAREGKQALEQLGVPAEVIGQLETLGNQANGIEIGIANEQAAYNATQYNHQLTILNRNLADAEALMGKQVGSQGRLGQLQRENFDLGKKQQQLQFESQALSLDLSQRQINFQRAIAGFVAPGTTPEERAARIAEAKKEADFAQKQLDIQKELFGLGKKQFVVGVDIFNETAKRQVQDLKFALADLEKGHELQIHNAAALQAIAAIRAREAQVTAEIGVGIEKGTKVAALAIQSALDIANASGEAFGKILLQTAHAWSTFVTQGADAVISLILGAGGGGSGGGGGGKKKIPFASGIIGDTMGPTDITVGEASGEKVAILKNPKLMPMSSLANAGVDGGSMGPGIQMTIIVTGNKIANDADEQQLAERIGSQVEERLMRKTSLFGIRRI